MFFATGILNLGNYLFHVFMIRMLGPALYGILASSISLIYILSIPVLTLTMVIVKYTAEYKGKNNFEALGGLYFYFRNKTFFYGIVSMIILLIISPFIMSFLHISSWMLILLIIVNFFISFFPILNKSVLQGMSNFFAFAVTSMFEISGKFFLGLLLVYLGFKVEGAFAGILLSGIIAYIVAGIFIRKLKLKKNVFTYKKEVILFAVPVFFTNFALTSLFTTDIILARHFLTAVEAGYYASLSILGKIIYYAVFPIVGVMVPMVSEHHARGHNYKKILLFSIALTVIGAGIIVAIYFLFPTLIIVMLFGKGYRLLSPFVGIFGVFIGIYSVCSLLINFYLSVHKTAAVYLVSFAAIMEIALISLFHGNIVQIITMNVITVVFLLFALIVYYPLIAIRN